MTQPSFIERDYDAIKQRLMNYAPTIQPTDPEYILLEQIAYEIYLLRCNVQDACAQNLLDYSNYPVLDYLGDLRSCTRNENESDDDYRKRIKLSLNDFAVAAPRDAYIYKTKSVSNSIIDVYPYSPSREDGTPSGEAYIYLLAEDFCTEDNYMNLLNNINSLTQDELLLLNRMKEIRNNVENSLSSDRERAMTDKIVVLFPNKKVPEYTVNIVFKSALQDIALAVSNLKDKAKKYIIEIKNQLGTNFITSELIARLQTDDIYSLNIVEDDTEIEPYCFVDATIKISYNNGSETVTEIISSN